MNDRTSDAVEILALEFGDDAEYQKMLAEERMNFQAAKAIYELRSRVFMLLEVNQWTRE